MNDSLPYIDVTHEYYEEYAAHLVEEEMKRLPPRKVEALPTVRFERSALMKGEFERLQADRAATPLIKNLPLSAPTENTVEAWEEAVRRAKIDYEKERIRRMLLKISKDGSTAAEQWKGMNAHLDVIKSDLEKSLQEQKASVDAINLQRQSEQEQMGKELHVLSTQYSNLIEKTRQLKQAVVELKEELG